MTPGWIVILNGVPRSGKSSIAREIQKQSAQIWLNLGVDNAGKALPPQAWPGIGLRPGGERPDLEPLVGTLYTALFESIAAHSRQGLNVVSDLGIHDGYSQPLGILDLASQAFRDLPVFIVGVRCPLAEIMRRRDQEPEGSGYARTTDSGEIPPPVLRWESEVHRGKTYDLEVDTSTTTPESCAQAILTALAARMI